MKDFKKAKKTVDVTVGESVRIIRELQEMSHNELAELTGIPKSTISAIENDRVKLGIERAKVIAIALKYHPVVLAFPDWKIRKETAAWLVSGVRSMDDIQSTISEQSNNYYNL